MRHKKLKLCAILLLGVGLTGLQAQTMYIKKSNGSQTAYTVSNVRKMTFASGNVTFQKTDNSTEVFALSGLIYLSFSDFTTGIDKQQIQAGNTTLITYPNPVVDVLNIDLTSTDNQNGSISILSLEGKIIQTEKTAGKSIVILNLSQLPQGIYICRYNSGTENKTVKIIKQ
jgi:hypothetical protein